MLCRGVYTNHIQGTTKPKLRVKAWLRKTDLASASLSVWRLGKVGDSEAMAQLLQQKGNAELVRVMGVTAGRLRSLRIDGRRALCVLDDTLDGPDTRHPAHAAVAACRERLLRDTESAEFNRLFDAVVNLCSETVIWQNAA